MNKRGEKKGWKKRKKKWEGKHPPHLKHPMNVPNRRFEVFVFIRGCTILITRNTAEYRGKHCFCRVYSQHDNRFSSQLRQLELFRSRGNGAIMTFRCSTFYGNGKRYIIFCENYHNECRTACDTTGIFLPRYWYREHPWRCCFLPRLLVLLLDFFPITETKSCIFAPRISNLSDSFDTTYNISVLSAEGNKRGHKKKRRRKKKQPLRRQLIGIEAYTTTSCCRCRFRRIYVRTGNAYQVLLSMSNMSDNVSPSRLATYWQRSGRETT